MNPREQLDAGMKARKGLQDFFWGKRDILKRIPDKGLKRQFLGEINGIANELELKAVRLAEKGEKWESVLETAQKEVDKLKAEFLKRLGKGDTVMSSLNQDTIRELESL